MESARKEVHELGIGELPTLGYADLEGIIDNAVFLSQTHLHAVLGGSVQEALMVISGQMWGPGKTFGWVGECVCVAGEMTTEAGDRTQRQGLETQSWYVLSFCKY